MEKLHLQKAKHGSWCSMCEYLRESYQSLQLWSSSCSAHVDTESQKHYHVLRSHVWEKAA